MAEEKDGAQLIVEERRRQIEVKYHTLENDKQWPVRYFVAAAGAYLGLCKWPWHLSTFHFDDSGEGDYGRYYVKRNLVKAGALIAAAIDRLESD